MKKVVLCDLTPHEADEYFLLLQNLEALRIVQEIKLEKGALTSELKRELLEKRKQKNDELNLWWETITSKYGIPYFADSPMEVDAQKGIVFVWRK